MNPAEFKGQLDRARNTLLSSKNYHSLYVQVRTVDQALLDRYLGFFSTTESALRLMALLYLSGLFDTGPKTAGLPTLIRIAEKDPAYLATYSKLGDLRSTKTTLIRFIYLWGFIWIVLHYTDSNWSKSN